MKADAPKKAEKDLSGNTSNHGRDLLLALSRAVHSFQRARTADDFYRGLGREIESLGGMLTLLIVNEDRTLLTVAYTSYGVNLLQGVEKAIGRPAVGYSFSIESDSIYARKIISGNSEYVHWKAEHLMGALPAVMHPMVDKIMEVFNINQGILAPLRVEDETLGLMMVSDLPFDEDDMPVIESFAGQTAAGLQNVRLMQKLNGELAARRQLEESLKHNRDLLLALSGAAQAVQLVREPEDIYRVIGEQIKALGFEATILMFGDDHKSLHYRYTTMSEKVIHAAEIMAGVKARDYNWSIPPDSIYGRIIKEGKAEYIPWAGNLFKEILPEFLQRLSESLMQILKAGHGILAPLRVGEESFGILIVFGSDTLSSEDLPAIDSFAGQVSVSLRNALLAQQAQNEIKERTQAEAALRASEAKIHALMDAIPDMMFILDREGNFRGYHAADNRSLYAPPESFLGKNISDVMPPQMVAVYKSKFEMAMQSGKSQLFEYTLEGAQGYLYFEAHLVVDRSDQVLCIIRDITSRKKNEEAVKQAERHFKALIENAPDGIALVGLNGKIQYISPSAKKMFGYDTEEDVFVMEPMEFIHPDDLAFVLSVINGLVQDFTYTPTIQYRYRNKDNSYHWVESTFSNLLTDPSVQAVVINFRDITERKLASEKLYRQYENLNRLYQMTAILSQTTNIEDIYSAALESLQYTLFSDRASILLFDSDGVMRFKAWSGLSDAYRKAAEGHSPWRQDTHDPQPLLVPDVNTEPSLSSLLPVISEEGIVALGFIPLVHQGKLLGKFMIYFDTPHIFSADEVQLSQTIASHVAFAIFRKQVEEALRISEERYRILYEDIPSMYFTADIGGTILSVNKFVYEQLGYSAKELAGQSILNVFHPDDRENVRQHFLLIHQDMNRAVQLEARKVRKDGSILWVRESARAVHDINGHVVVLLVCDDVTERKQAQEALAASLSELHALFASMQDAVLVIDRGGVYRKIAPTNPEKFYLQPENVIGKKLMDFFPSYEVDRFLGAIRHVLDTQRTVQIEYKLEVNGASPWFESSISPLDENHTIWVARDISERKQAEEKLYLQSAALEAAANAILITDHNGIIEWANSSFTNLTGFDSKEVVGMKPGRLIKSGKQSPEFYEEMWGTILAGNIWHKELINRRKDGRLYFEEMTITPLRNLEGDIRHFIAVKQDISERKHAEEALIRSEKAYRTLFETLPIGLYRTSVDGRVLDANPALIKMFGYENLQSFMERRAEDFYADIDTNEKFLAEILKQDVLSAFEAEFCRRDQTIFWAEDYVNVIRDEAGKPLYFEGSLIDTTDRKKSENDLKEMNKSLQLAHSELQQMFEHEQVLARTDSLTAQANRRYFFELAAREFNSAIRYQRPLTIILFDIDGFKQVNDTFGHTFGDRLLIQVAQTTAVHVRNVDVLARYGGDEFIILLPETTDKQAFHIAERIREHVASTRLEVENGPFAITLSLGIAEIIYTPQDLSIEDVIRRADQALYQAKKNGRNHAIIYKKKTAKSKEE